MTGNKATKTIFGEQHFNYPINILFFILSETANLK